MDWAHFLIAFGLVMWTVSMAHEIYTPAGETPSYGFRKKIVGISTFNLSIAGVIIFALGWTLS